MSGHTSPDGQQSMPFEDRDTFLARLRESNDMEASELSDEDAPAVGEQRAPVGREEHRQAALARVRAAWHEPRVFDPDALKEHVEGWNSTLGEVIDDLRLEQRHTHRCAGNEMRCKILDNAVRLDTLDGWRGAIADIVRLHEIEGGPIDEVAIFGSSVPDNGRPALSASLAEARRLTGKGMPSYADVVAVIGEDAALELAKSGRPSVYRPVTYFPPAGRRVVRLLAPFKIGDDAIRSLTISEPSAQDIEDLALGRITTTGLRARMAGVPEDVIRSLKWADSEVVSIVCRLLAPDMEGI